MVDAVAATRYPTPQVLRAVNVTAKASLLLMLATAVIYPEIGNMEDKAAGLRAVGYPMLAFTVPAIWYAFWRERASFPWLADTLITLTCFTDILGNRMDLYDSIYWFDDWMHFINLGILAAAFILLTMAPTTQFWPILERGLAVGGTAAILWEIAEYYAFIATSSERRGAYRDTLGDLGLGMIGVVLAVVIIHSCWRQGYLRTVSPQLTNSM
ncbi:hypothetical protein ACLM5J_02680 [Nocardioides sp. Bht2]|uniref:hypothetical protein n=1 Tax=Nocardioides sp. Bht2 TaxID=3392297 RepID=UPI0039B3847E